MENMEKEKDPSIIPEDIKEFVRAAHKAQRESRPDESWRIQRAQKADVIDAPYKQDEESMETSAQPMIADDALMMAKGGVVPGFADGAYPGIPGIPGIDPLLLDPGSGMLAPSPADTPPAAPQPVIPNVPVAPSAPKVPSPVVKQPDPIVSRETTPDMTDADYQDKAANLLGTNPGEQAELMKSIGRAQQRGSFGTAIAGIGDAIASGGTLGKVNPGGAQRSQDMLKGLASEGIEGMQTIRTNKEKTRELSEKLQAQDPKSPLSRYAQKAYAGVGKKVGLDLSNASASLIADVTGKGVQELSDEAQLAVRKEGLDIQRGQLAATKENNAAQRLHDEAVLKETAHDKDEEHKLASTAKATEAATKLGNRSIGNKIESWFPWTSAHTEKEALERQAAGETDAGGSVGPYGAETVRNGKTYEWSPETGKYHLKQ